MAPVMHGLEEKYSGKVNFAFLDIDDPSTERFQEQLRVYYQPEFSLLDADGNVVKEYVVYIPTEKKKQSS